MSQPVTTSSDWRGYRAHPLLEHVAIAGRSPLDHQELGYLCIVLD